MTARVCRIVYDEETKGYDNMVAKGAKCQRNLAGNKPYKIAKLLHAI